MVFQDFLSLRSKGPVAFFLLREFLAVGREASAPVTPRTPELLNLDLTILADSLPLAPAGIAHEKKIFWLDVMLFLPNFFFCDFRRRGRMPPQEPG